jgi:hypothetical protein
LNGLEVILTHFGLHEISTPRDDATKYWVEACGLLDMPGFTLGRRNPCKRIWSRFVTPLHKSGIEPTSGLPRSLLDIQAWGDSPGAEHELLMWQPDKAEHIIQYHFWEAFRLGTLLLHRSLRAVNGAYRDANANSREYLVMGIFASVNALRNASKDPFRTPLRRGLLFPLWIAALNTEDNSESRSIASREFEAFVAERDFPVDRMAWAALLEVWTQRRSDPELSPFAVADEFINEMGVELHLY